MKGIKGDGFTLYKGIPYAHAKRFGLPELVRLDMDNDYTAWPPMAWQAGREPGSFYDKEFYDQDAEYIMDENCQYLNIWVPDGAENAPVAMFIHGGAFDHGFSYEKEFDGSALCKKGVIVITIGYRVGIFGYLYHPDFAPNPNLGLEDQKAAVRWIHENISSFGGDPYNLTVFGQSAGCMSTCALIQSPDISNLISKAIFQSGILPELSISMKQAEQTASSFLEFSGFDDAAKLLEADPKTLTDLQTAFLKKHPMAFIPVSTRDLSTPFLQDDLPVKPYLVGLTLNDIMTDPNQIKLGNRGPLYEACTAFCQKEAEDGNPNIYMYDFIRKLPGDDAGAFHSSELWYVFGTLDKCWRPMEKGDYQLSSAMIKAWSDFMKTGKPGWKPWPYVQELDV